jgi:hypothetical protein
MLLLLNIQIYNNYYQTFYQSVIFAYSKIFAIDTIPFFIEYLKRQFRDPIQTFTNTIYD